VDQVDASNVAELWRPAAAVATLLQHFHAMMGVVFQRARAWSRSLYWRIAVSLAVFTRGMLLVQNMLFRYLLERPDPSFLSPNAMALLVAADMQQVVA